MTNIRIVLLLLKKKIDIKWKIEHNSTATSPKCSRVALSWT